MLAVEMVTAPLTSASESVKSPTQRLLKDFPMRQTVYSNVNILPPQPKYPKSRKAVLGLDQGQTLIFSWEEPNLLC